MACYSIETVDGSGAQMTAHNGPPQAPVQALQAPVHKGPRSGRRLHRISGNVGDECDRSFPFIRSTNIVAKTILQRQNLETPSFDHRCGPYLRSRDRSIPSKESEVVSGRLKKQMELTRKYCPSAVRFARPAGPRSTRSQEQSRAPPAGLRGPWTISIQSQ